MGATLVDLRTAFRTLRRSPLISVAAILTLAFGIGPTVAMFTLVNAALVQPLPYPESHRLVVAVVDDRARGDLTPLLAGPEADAVLAMPIFDRVSRLSVGGGLMVGGTEPDVVYGSAVEVPFFDLFGMPLVRGRLPARAGEAVIADALWQQRFGGRDDIIGAAIRYRDQSVTIVGVAGPRFDFPFRNRIWFVPTSWPEFAPGTRAFVDLALRLAPGVTLEAGRAALATRALALEREHPGTLDQRRLQLQSAHEAETGYLRQPLLMLLAAAALIVLLACANVANLLLASGTGRWREMAVRRAIGASPWRLVRSALVESALLATCGVGLGVLLAAWAVPRMLALTPDVITRQTQFVLSWPVLASTVLLGAVVTIVFGLMPALRLARVPAADTLNQMQPTPSAGHARAMATLVAVQVAVGVVLIVGTALLVASVARTMDAVDAMPADRLAAVRVATNLTRASAPRLFPAIADFVEEGGSELAASSGMLMQPVPSQPVHLPGSAAAVEMPVRAVSPNFFAVVGQRLVSGRAFTPGDRRGDPPVAIISETLARRLGSAGRADPLGATLRVTFGREVREVSVVGVAADVRATFTSRPGAEIYLPMRQAAELAGYWLTVFGPAASSGQLAASLRRVVRAIDVETPVGDPTRLDEMFRDRLMLPRFRAALMTSFGLLALALAAAGVFAMTLYVVARRTREFAVRIAVGASARDLVGAVVPVVAVPVGLGVVVGLVVATQLATYLRGMLFYDLSVTSPPAYLGAAAVFAATALVATAIPLRRVWRVNPAESLRRD